jgi:hypothetical protein
MTMAPRKPTSPKLTLFLTTSFSFIAGLWAMIGIQHLFSSRKPWFAISLEISMALAFFLLAYLHGAKLIGILRISWGPSLNDTPVRRD